MKRKATIQNIKFVTKESMEAFGIRYVKKLNAGYQDFKKMEEEQILDKINSLMNLYDETAKSFFEVIGSFHTKIKKLDIEFI